MYYNFVDPWAQLQEACVGCVYHPDFFQDVKNTEIKHKLTQILIETNKDLDNIATVLTSLGVKVHRPDLPTGISIMDFVDSNNTITHGVSGSNTLIPRPPLQLRDSFFVSDQTLYRTRDDGIYVKNMLDAFGGQQRDLREHKFDAPLVTVIGDRAYVDTLENPLLGDVIKTALPDKQVISVATGGHNDAVFSVIRPGVLITLEDPAIYQETFPGYDILSLPKASWRSELRDFRQLKRQNGGRWWAPDSVDNREFVSFVDSWLTEWVGYAAETVFDVNCLVVNASLVLINNYNSEVDAFFKKHNIDYIVTPLRHRFFWDGGIHCVTNDLVRS